MDTDAVIQRLDLLVAVLKLAHSTEISAVRDRLRNDPTSAAILDATAEETVASGDLQKSVVASTGVSKRTVQSRLQELAALGALRQSGSGPNTAYRSTGLL